MITRWEKAKKILLITWDSPSNILEIYDSLMKDEEQNDKVEINHFVILKRMFHMKSKEIFETNTYSNFEQQGMAFSKGFNNPFILITTLHHLSFLSLGL